MTNKIDLEQVEKVAKLARLQLDDEEKGQFAGQLSSILEYIEKMEQLDTGAAEPLAHCLDVFNNFREDKPAKSLGTEKTLKNAPQQDGEFFLVPKILDDNSA
jgi:aspartyl-tRNA(Asn)/glutamyl-tRNA(Gln) amidotransferase subunit C